jgi:hypothetical protein
MPGFALDAAASVLCAHGGQAAPVTPNPRVRVGGQPATTMSSPFSIAGCPFNVSGSPVPCLTAQWVVGATRVRAMGVPILLQDSQAVCAPNGTPVNVVVTQMRVKAV